MDERLFSVDWNHCIGAGGEGEVFLGRSLETMGLCAVKVSVFLDRAAARRQLRNELERTRRAAGEGVVGLLAWNLDAPRPFLVFELAHAGTLEDEMRELYTADRVYHPVRALSRVRKVLAALDKLHERGLVHLDVKPANLLRFGQDIKLTDFGTGRTLTSVASEPQQELVGTLRYAAPEQIRGDTVDQRADLYAVGCMLHEMVTGALPPPGSAERVYPHVLVLPALDRLLSALLDERPARRPFTAAEAIGRVDECLSSYLAARRTWSELGLGPSPY